MTFLEANIVPSLNYVALEELQEEKKIGKDIKAI